MSPQPARLFAALALALALAACQKPSGGDDATPSLTLGDSTRGEITSSSGLNYNDGSRHQGYRISLKKGQAVALELGGALAGQLAIFDGQTLLASASSRGYENDNGGSGNVSLAFRAPRDGSYLVAVNSAGADAFGPFKLDASAVVPYDGKPLLAGSTAIDWLIGDKQQYTLKVDKAGIYTIDMESSALDSYLNLSGGALDLDDDDSGNRLDARIRTYLEPGEYTLSASSVNGNTGAFKLSVAMTAVDHAIVVRDGSALTIGQPAQGMIDGQGRRSFVLVLDSPRQIRFDALSDNFDSVLQISGPGVDAEDDDGGSGTNARLSLTLGAGRYNVVVSSLSGQQGMFILETTDLGRGAGAGVDSNRKSETAAEDAATASGH